MTTSTNNSFTKNIFSATSEVANENKLWWIFRIFICWEFVGHGAFGVITKAGWLPFFAVVGIPESVAWKMMPVVGTFDILMGLIILFTPRKSILLWMTIWGVWTALLRPLSGTSFSEFFERAYNFGFPFLMLYLLGFGKNTKEWFSQMEYPKITVDKLKFSKVFLQIAIASYLIGHACFGLFDNQKTMLGLHAASNLSSLFSNTINSGQVFGIFEILLAALVLIIPNSAVLILICAWKVFTEGLYIPFGGKWGVFEFIERGSSYAMPISLIYIQRLLSSTKNS